MNERSTSTSMPQISPLTNRATGPQARRLVRQAARTALSRFDRWTLTAFNPTDLVPRQRRR